MTCERSHVPNDTTLKVLEEMERGENLVGPFSSVEELIKDLDAPRARSRGKRQDRSTCE